RLYPVWTAGAPRDATARAWPRATRWHTGGVRGMSRSGSAPGGREEDHDALSDAALGGALPRASARRRLWHGGAGGRRPERHLLGFGGEVRVPVPHAAPRPDRFRRQRLAPRRRPGAPRAGVVHRLLPDGDPRPRRAAAPH